MDWTRFLLRMAMWIRRPPSKGYVRLFLIVVVLCFAVVAVEKIFGRPDWMHVQKIRH